MQTSSCREELYNTGDAHQDACAQDAPLLLLFPTRALRAHVLTAVTSSRNPCSAFCQGYMRSMDNALLIAHVTMVE